MPYIPTTDAERQKMLERIGVATVEDLFADIPDNVRFRGRLNVPAGMSEGETLAHLKELAASNVNTEQAVCFLGAGAYDHLLPAALDSIVGRSEFVTAYTPYQAEVSQGELQAMYEFQTLICQLTSLDVANSSLYDGASGLGEACIMAVAAKNRGNVVISATVHPDYIKVAQTYLQYQGVEVRIVPANNGLADVEALAAAMDEDTAAVCAQQPNAYGLVEQMAPIGDVAAKTGALFISVVDPISLSVLSPPGEYGADIAVGEGQSLGTPVSFGGPYAGFIAARKHLVRRLPGRIVGRTVDQGGKPGFVLTLQAREQHIRRERAVSNICTNQALIALRATVYMALLGKSGFRQAGNLCVQKAHYARQRLLEIPGWEPEFAGPVFKEFVLRAPMDPDTLNERLLDYGIIGGFPLKRWDSSLSRAIMFCVTEARTKEEIDRLAAAAADITKNEGVTRDGR